MDRDRYRALFIEVDCDLHEKLFEIWNESINADIVFSSSTEESIKWLELEEFDVVLVDIDHVEVEFIKDISTFEVPVVAITSKNNEEVAHIAIQQGAQDCLLRNGILNRSGLRRSVLHAINRHQYYERKSKISSHDLIAVTEMIHNHNTTLYHVTGQIGAVNAALKATISG